MKTYCPTDDAYIERSDTVRGYEVAPGQYVVVTDDDLAAVPLKTVRSIEIEQFVPIDSDGQTTRFVKQAYYLEPEPIARKAFFLLKDVLAERGLRAIAKIVLRDREQLASIDPYASTMLLSTLHWPDEIRSLGELSLPEIEVEAKPAERAMAAQLVDAMTTEFDPAAYHDEYREALLGIIEAKAGGAVIAAPAPASAAGVTDLMAALEASVAAARTARASAAPETIEEAKARPARRATSPAPAKPQGEAEADAVPARRRKSA
jgi:DNA end-binding protein Ku